MVKKEPLTFNGFVDSLKKVVSAPAFWGVAGIGLGIIPSLYFATQWFPSYFTQVLEHAYDQTLSTKLVAIYFMQDVGLWVSGLVVFLLANRGISVLKARKMVVSIAFIAMLSILLAPLFKSDMETVVIFAIYVCGIGAFLGNQHAFKQDVLKDNVGMVAALVGFIEMTFTFLVLRHNCFGIRKYKRFHTGFILLAGWQHLPLLWFLFL